MQIHISPESGHSPPRTQDHPANQVGWGGIRDYLRINFGAGGLRRWCRATRFSTPLLINAILIDVATDLFPKTAWAHVKWFAPYDVSRSPVPVSDVLSRNFMLTFASFMLLMIGSFLLDRLTATKIEIMTSSGKYEDVEERLLRAGTGAFFMALFTTGGTILTPELHTIAEWPSWLQLAIAASMLSTRTCALGAVGILVLYGYGIALYGIFHLSDYPMFIGLAAYLALTSFQSQRLRSRRMLILHASICISLMWGAVEKWAYPQWTFPLLAVRPYLTFGLTPQTFMVAAGFVEFAFAFYILTGFGLLRLAILGIGTIFAAAILDFGKLDVIGHLPILVSLACMFLHGPTQLQCWFHEKSKNILARAHTGGTAFATTVFIFLAAYYGLQYTEYGPDPHGSGLGVVSHAP